MATEKILRNLDVTGFTGTFGELIDKGLTPSLGVYTNASKQLTSVAPATGKLGFWNRTGIILSPRTVSDNLDMGSGTITGVINGGSA